jgi:hypothetical protein
MGSDLPHLVIGEILGASEFVLVGKRVMMNYEKLIRATLAASFVFNLLAAYMLVFPASSLASLAGFTISTSPMHTALSALMVAALGGSYGWMALQENINIPMLTFGALTKGSAFMMFFVQWTFDAVTARLVLFAVVDIVLAWIWLNWVIKRRRVRP